MSSDPVPPDRARVVVVGGGVIGTSVAYHLARAGESDVLLLERDRLTSGPTWHAAGLMTCFGSLSETVTRLRLSSRDLYARLEEETGRATGFRPVGLVEAAADTERLEEYRRVAAFQRRLGLEVEEVSAAEMTDLFPLAETADLLAGFHVPGDGRVNPVDLTTSLAAGARAGGVRVVEGVSVTGVRTVADGAVERVTGVATTAGDVECEVVVNAAGMWARELAGRSGVVVPNQAAEHYYVVTEPIEGVHRDLPVFEDPASYGYYREEGGGLMVGLFEPEAAAWALDGVPEGFSFGTIRPDLERVGPFLERAMARVPVVADAGIRTFFCGPESFTPDLAPAVGEAPGVRGYFVCAGMNSVGVLSAGGIGRILATWVVDGEPDVDVSAIDVARFRDWQLDPRHRAERTAEILGTVYAAHPPGGSLRTSRGVVRSPLHDRLLAAGACLVDVAGRDVPEYFAGPGERPEPDPSWSRRPWFAHWEAEHRAVRDGAGVCDLSHRTRLLVRGASAGEVLTRAGVVGPEVTTVAWDGGILVVGPATRLGRLETDLRRAVGDDDVEVVESADIAVLGVLGPEAEKVLGAVDTTGVTTCAAEGEGAPGLLLVTPADEAGSLWDGLLAVGARPVGRAARRSLRTEAGDRAAPGGLVHLVLESPEPLLVGGEVLLRDGAVVGVLRSGSYGWSVGAAVGLGAVDADEPLTDLWLAGGRWEVDVAGTRHPSRLARRPPLDPRSVRST